MALTFYRYVHHSDEVDQLRKERRIRTTNPKALGTWFTTGRYDDPLVAQRRLALSQPPTHRIGPIPEDQMPPFTPLRTVAPAGPHPGGGDETLAIGEVFLFGLWGYRNGEWEL